MVETQGPCRAEDQARRRLLMSGLSAPSTFSRSIVQSAFLQMDNHSPPFYEWRYPPAASRIATAKTSVNAGRHRGPIDEDLPIRAWAQRVGGAPKEARRRWRKTLQGSQNLRTSRASTGNTFSVEHGLTEPP